MIKPGQVWKYRKDPINGVSLRIIRLENDSNVVYKIHKSRRSLTGTWNTDKESTIGIETLLISYQLSEPDNVTLILSHYEA